MAEEYNPDAPIVNIFSRRSRLGLNSSQVLEDKKENPLVFNSPALIQSRPAESQSNNKIYNPQVPVIIQPGSQGLNLNPTNQIILPSKFQETKGNLPLINPMIKAKASENPFSNRLQSPKVNSIAKVSDLTQSSKFVISSEAKRIPAFSIVKVSSLSCFPMVKTQKDYSKVNFHSEHLSEIPMDTLQPLVIPATLVPLPVDTLNLLKNIVPLIEISNETPNIIQLASENPELIQVIKETFDCICGNRSQVKLPCMHSLCNKCCSTYKACPKCNSPISSYLLDLPEYTCLKCRSLKSRKLACKHYCLDCVVHKLKFTRTFECLICPITFSHEQFENFCIKCEACNETGKYLEESFHETCDSHALCYKCFKKSLQNRACAICSRNLDQKEYAKLAKCTKFSCDMCLKRKRLPEMKQKLCCSSKLCTKCYDPARCPICRVNN